MRPLRVGLNLCFLGPQAGGVGRYATALPGALLDAEPATEIVLYVGRDAPGDLYTEPWANQVRWRVLPHLGPGLAGQLAEHAILPLLATADGVAVLHSPANTGPVITPGIRSIVSLMDLIWLHHAHDWNPDPRAQRAMRRQVGHAVRNADLVLAISHAAANEIAAGLRVDRERIAVTPLGVSPMDVTPTAEPRLRDRFGLGGRRVVLCVAQKRRYKNLTAIVEALPRLPADVVAVMPGAPSRYEAEMRTRATQLGVTDRLVLPDWVSDSDLVGLYRLATAFVLPTLAEGFGLPVLEAMMHGTPVACSDLPVLHEVAGDAALFFDPRDPGQITEAIGRLLDDESLRTELRARARTVIAQFSWKHCGEATLDAYHRVCAT